MDLQYILTLLGNTGDKVKKLDWSRLIPKFRADQYKYGVLGVELTMPWGREGLGIGFGLARVDLWFGWPRKEEDLHTATCEHPVVRDEVPTQ